jgi:CheY-like chemotaxis protein/HPt (histidine-containing phosphotransfer) domain-containing protein
MMGGHINVDSTPNEGSTFTVELALPIDVNITVTHEPALRNITAFVPHTSQTISYLINYLKHEGANVVSSSDLDTIIESYNNIEPVHDDNSLFIVDLAEEPYMYQRLVSAVGSDSMRTLHLERGRRRKPRMKGEDVTVDANAIFRHQLVKAVLATVGHLELEPPSYLRASANDATPASTPASDSLSHYSILLAEDNKTNQQVITQQLSLLGYSADIADNGVIAYEMWKNSHYDLLLTDFHMPEMDGIELTEKVRAEEKSTGNHIPIIAITANAIKGERDRMIQAGMDDYLSKPITLAEFRKAMDKWLPITDNISLPPTPDEQTGATPPTDISNCVNPDILKEIIGDDMEMIREFLIDFRDQSKSDIDEILEAHASNDIALVAANSHKLKSAARTVGAELLADVCYKLEKAGKEGDTTTINDNISVLTQCHHNVVNFIDLYTEDGCAIS